MIRYALSGAAGISAAVAVGWLTIARHPPPPSPEVREEEPHRKGDRLPIHRPPLPAPEVTAAPAPVVMDVEPAPPRKKNVCEQNGGIKIDRGRSWHCQYPKRRK
jgi:hypothetical protein